MFSKKVVYLPAWLDGCAKWRMYIPHLNVKDSMFLFNSKRTPIELYSHCNIAVVQRQCLQENLNALRLIKQTGLKLVYDLDDNLWNLPSYNPAKNEFAMMSEGLEVCANECDVMTVSTEGLKTAARTAMPKLKLDIHVIPNMVDFRFYKRNPLSRDDGQIKIGWAGSNTHDGDIVDAWKAVPEIINAHENVIFEVVGGTKLPPELQKHSRAKFKDWVDVAEYASRFSSWAWDIMLAPLEDNRFNRSKSNIKMIEAGACGCVCLASAVRPYLEFCEHDRELTWLLCRTAADWKRKLLILTDPASNGIIEHYAKRMHDAVEKHYNIGTKVNLWTDLFESLG